LGVFAEAPPGADKARRKRRSGQNSSSGSEKRILGTARGGEAEDAGCSSHLAPGCLRQPPPAGGLSASLNAKEKPADGFSFTHPLPLRNIEPKF